MKKNFNSHCKIVLNVLKIKLNNQIDKRKSVLLIKYPNNSKF